MSRAADLFQRTLDGGINRIKSMIVNKETEELFLDYKRSADNGSGTSLHNTDKSNLAKAVSGFGNSEGGLIIWGVDCRNEKNHGDVPVGAVMIQNPIRFKSWLEQATTGTTVPPHDGVRHEAIFDPSASIGFVLTYIPKGNHSPYQTIPDLRYMMRSGSNFAPVPHGVLAGMFGRRPQPSIYPNFTAEQNYYPHLAGLNFRFSIDLWNSGEGIGEDVYLNFDIIGTGGPNNFISTEHSAEGPWHMSTYFNHRWSFMLKREHRIAPGATLMATIVNMYLEPPFDSDFRLCITAGADRAVPYRMECHVPNNELTIIFDTVTRAPQIQIRERARSMLERLLRR